MHIILFILLFCSGYSQKFTLSGYIKDKKSGEDLPFANIYIEEIKKGVSSNNYGFYSISLPPGKYTIKVSYVGYNTLQYELNLQKDISINFYLEPIVIVTKEVVISAEKENKNVENVNMGTFKIPIEQVKELPVVFGETDILKTVQLLPGVQFGGEGNTSMYVRGGGPDQNLVLLDNAIVYNPGHLFGFFSIFNSDAIKDVTLIKGDIPANYGGRLSSVLDIIMKEGNLHEIKGIGGIGLIASRFTLEGPIKKEKISFLISGRRTYADVILKPIMKNLPTYYFYDLNGKINYILNHKHRLFLSTYYGKDIFSLSSKNDSMLMKFPWGNFTISGRWNFIINKKLFHNLTITFSNYKYEFIGEHKRFAYKMNSSIYDYAISSDFTYLPHILHNIKFGFKYIYHKIIPSYASLRIGETNFDWSIVSNYYSNDFALYLNDEFEITDKIKISAGIRLTLFQHIGPFKRYILDYKFSVIDSIYYEKNKIIASYPNFEPRILLRYLINEQTSIKTAFTKCQQFIQLGSLSSNTLPTDIWIPATEIIKPQISYQLSFGLFRNFLNNNIETSIELYYKKMYNLIEYKEGVTSDYNLRNNPDNNFTIGQGLSYGSEFFIRKKFGKLTGWIGYTLSKTTRKFPEINNGKEFPAKYDRRHDLSLIITYDIMSQLKASFVFVYATGDCATLPINILFLDGGKILYEYGERNSYRMPPYHRADISITYNFKQKPNKKFNYSLNFSIYNIYNRKNPFFIYIDPKTDYKNNTVELIAKQVSIFGFIPSLTFNFNF